MKKEPLNETLARLYAASNWFQMPRHLMAIMSRDEAILLAYLMNRACIVKYKLKGGWFYQTSKQIESRLFLNYDAQHHTIKNLVKGGWVETKRAGSPAKRYFKINYKAVDLAIREFLAKRRAEKRSGTVARSDLAQLPDCDLAQLPAH